MYLLKTDGKFPITAAQLREAIGLKSDKMDLILAAGIGSMCSMSVKAVQNQTWLIAEGSPREKWGVVVSVDPAPVRGYGQDKRTFYAVTYAPDPQAVETVFVRCQRWALNQHDVALAMAEEQV